MSIADERERMVRIMSEKTEEWIGGLKADKGAGQSMHR